MIAEILATGDEVATGAVVDSNSAYIAEKLEENGIDVVRHICVKDDLVIMTSVIKEISARSDVAVVTGGLGPTVDDITALAAARAAGVELVLNKAARKSMEAYFKVRNWPISESNNKQAFMPDGAECMDNSVGTAPGFILKINKCCFFFLPGVPHEMKKMLKNKVLPEIEKLRHDATVHLVKTLSLFGLPEAGVDERLKGFEEVFPDIKLGLRADFPVINIKFYARGTEKANMERVLEEAAVWGKERMGGAVFSENGDSMESTVGHLLLEKKATIAVAESCTGGLISHMLTNVPGSSGYFRFSGITYSNDAKKNILGVPAETIEKHGAVSEETVKAMAEGVRKISGSTYGLATSGIAGPDGGTPDKPVGTVCIGLAGPDGTRTEKFYFTFAKRMANKMMFAVTALNVLRKELKKKVDG